MPASASRIQVGSGERRLLLLLSALVAFGPLSIDMYLPSLPAIAADLGASDAQVQRSISGFLVGFCVGMLFYGPLSDRFGRRPVLLAGIALYLFSSLACALADSAGQLVLLRVLQALGGGAASVLARAMVRDLYPLGEAARMLALMHMVTMLAPLAAPLLGGYLMLWAGWRALFVVLALFAGLCLLAVWRVAESHPPERRGGSLAQAFLAYGRLLGDRRALGYVLCMGLAFAGMFAYISAAPFVFIEHFGVRAERFGWFFGLNILGVMLATWCSARLVRRHGSRPLLRAGSLLACVSGLFLLGYAALGERGGLWALVPGLLCFVSVTGLLGANCIASLLA
ncbi:Bcr/CflA family multidrug efflux MFS transporter, partial [Pseudomonas aeruginosa]|nr:Bcr/CflA family multidrug efflux MFS transporter [Pseudomonas aeruginosa]